MPNYHLTSVCILLACAGCAAATNAQSATLIELQKTSSTGQSPKSDQSLMIQRLVGNWEATRFGHQVLTARPNGTATIDITLTPMAAVLYGRHVTLDLIWTLDGNVWTQTIVGGSPAKSVKKLIAKFGGTQCYHVLECQNDYLLVSNGDRDSEPIRWNAVSSTE